MRTGSPSVVFDVALAPLPRRRATAFGAPTATAFASVGSCVPFDSSIATTASCSSAIRIGGTDRSSSSLASTPCVMSQPTSAALPDFAALLSVPSRFTPFFTSASTRA